MSRVAALMVIGGVMSVTIACGSGTPGASPTVTQTTRSEKDEAKPTVSGRTTAPGTETPEPPPPPHLLTFDFIDAENGWLAFGNSVSTTIMGTSDAGHSWAELYQTPSEVQSLDFISGSQGWMHSAEGLFETSDGGRTWQMVNGSDLPENSRVQFVDDAHGWATGNWKNSRYPGRIFASTDAGSKWKEFDSPCDGLVVGVSFVTVDSGSLACGGQPAAGMEPKELYHTADAGQHWVKVSCACFESDAHGVPNTMPWSGYLTDISFLDETHGWMDASRGGLSSTSDGGVSWGSLPTGVDSGDEFTNEAKLLSVEVGYVIAGCSGISRLLGTTDGGVTWSSLYPPPFIENCSTPELRSKPTHDLCGDSPHQ